MATAFQLDPSTTGQYKDALDTDPAILETHKIVMHRWCKEVFNGKNMAMVDELKVPNYADWSRFPGQAPTLESFKVTLGMFFTAFPDFQFSVEDTIVGGDMGMIRGTWRGTHTGQFMHLPPSGKEVGGKRIDFFLFSDGKMSEHWGAGLELPVLELMGFTPPNTLAQGDDVKSIVNRFVNGVLHQRNLVVADDLFTGYASEVLKKSLNLLALHAAIPDGQVTVEHTVSEGDRVAIHSTLTGTHLGAFLGIAPTGKPVSVTKVDVLRIAGGKIVESWHQWDNVSLLFQIGALGGPPSGNGAPR